METKKFRLTQSEINRADTTPGGRLFTIISRKQNDGRWMVLPIDIVTGLSMGYHFIEWADSKEGISLKANYSSKSLTLACLSYS